MLGSHGPGSSAPLHALPQQLAQQTHTPLSQSPSTSPTGALKLAPESSKSLPGPSARPVNPYVVFSKSQKTPVRGCRLALFHPQCQCGDQEICTHQRNLDFPSLLINQDWRD